MKKPLSSRRGEMLRLETLAAGDTVLHRLHPGVKLAGTLCFLVCVISLPPGALGQLLSFIWVPVLLLALGETPGGWILRRTAVALPFCLFAGLGNLILDRQVAMMLGPVPVTGGLLSFLGIVVRTLLCVSAVLILVAQTPFAELTGLLRRIHVPGLLVALLEMTCRYVGTLLDQAGTMSTAYHLRAGDRKGISMGDMGSFVGMLLLRSYDRAERVYSAMLCRGYGGAWGGDLPRKMRKQDFVALALLCGGPLLLRTVSLPELVGRWLSCLLSGI